MAVMAIFGLLPFQRYATSFTWLVELVKQRGLPLRFQAFLLLALQFLNALCRRGQVLGHGTAQTCDGLPDLFSYLIVRSVGLLFAADLVAAQLCVSLGSAKNIIC